MAVTALVVPVSGPYTGFWYGFALGTQNDDGFALIGAFTGQEINASNAYGMTLVEAIYRGLNWRVRFRGLEFNKPGILAAIHTFGSSSGVQPPTTLNPILTNIGNRYSKFAQALHLSSILGAYPPTMPQNPHREWCRRRTAVQHGTPDDIEDARGTIRDGPAPVCICRRWNES